MNYAALVAAISSYTENTFPTVDMNLFITQAEKRIYNAVQIPSLRKNVTGSTTTNNKYLQCPLDFLSTYSLAVIDPTTGAYTYLLNKDVNFIREAYPKRDGSADRKGAVKAFGSALKRAPLEIILDGARHFADAMTARGKTGTEFIPQARTWLNGDRWNERYESSTAIDDKQAKARAILEKYAYSPPESCS
jgi:hypothetical protein